MGVASRRLRAVSRHSCRMYGARKTVRRGTGSAAFDRVIEAFDLPDTNFSEIVGAAPQPPAANPRASRFVRLASRFALRWVAPIVSLAIGAAIGLALHSPNPQVTSRFPPRVAPAPRGRSRSGR